MPRSPRDSEVELQFEIALDRAEAASRFLNLASFSAKGDMPRWIRGAKDELDAAIFALRMAELRVDVWDNGRWSGLILRLHRMVARYVEEAKKLHRGIN